MVRSGVSPLPILLSAPQYYFICLSLKSGSPTQMSQKPPFLPGMHVAAFFCNLVRMSSEPSPGIDPSEWGWASGRRRKERSWAVSIQAVSPQVSSNSVCFLDDCLSGTVAFQTPAIPANSHRHSPSTVYALGATPLAQEEAELRHVPGGGDHQPGAEQDLNLGCGTPKSVLCPPSPQLQNRLSPA